MTRHLSLKVNIPEHRFGMTVPYLGKLYETISFVPGMKSAQTFMSDTAIVTTYDKELTAAYCQENDSSLYIHCPLNANLAKSYCPHSIHMVSQQLETIKGLPAACVLHVGKVGTIENVAQNINLIQSEGHLPISQSSRVPCYEMLLRNILSGIFDSFPLLLEIAAGQGTELGVSCYEMLLCNILSGIFDSWEEIRHLYEAMDSTRVGLCVDTQHAFGSGIEDSA